MRNYLVPSAVVFAVLSHCGFALADIDLILKPGESKSVFVSRPQAVNVACIQTAQPAPAPITPIEFTNSNATFCSDSARLLTLMELQSPNGELKAIEASCSSGTVTLNAKVWGVAVGTQARFYRRLSTANCSALSWIANDINQLKSVGSTVRAEYACDSTAGSEKSLTVTISRFQ